MTLIGFEHVGITANDVTKTKEFYCDLLGMTVRAHKSQEWGDLLFLDAGNAMLEIFIPSAPQMRATDLPKGHTGVKHITFAVDDVDAAIARFEAAGVEITERPREAKNTDFFRRVAFCRDPDGLSVELVQRV
jgi:glyoxylase I family protein